MTSRRRLAIGTRPAALVDLTAVRCIGYLRVSTEQQASEDRTSLADQERAIEAAAARRGLVVDAWFRDEGLSGATVEKRPQLRSLLASCEAHSRLGRERGAVLALNDSRWGRFPNPEEATYWRVHLERLGWDVRFAEGDDVDNTMARGVMRFIGAAQASEYRLNLQMNARRGIRGSSELGYWTRPEPFGYRRKVVFPAGRERVLLPGQRKAEDERVALTPYEPEAAIVRRLFAEYATGSYSLRSLSRWAAATWPDIAWTRRWIQRIITNPVYLGDLVSGPVTAKRGETYGKAGAHVAIVEHPLFAKVRDRMAANAAAPHSPASTYLVSGLVACSYCGLPYNGGGFGSVRSDGTRCQFYRCSSGSFDRLVSPCPGKIGTISKHFLEGAVVELIATELRKPGRLARLAAAVERYFARIGTDVSAEEQQLRREIARLEARRDNLVSAIAEGTLTPREASTQLANTRTAIESSTAQLQQRAFGRRGMENHQAFAEQLVAQARDFATAVATVPIAEARDLIGAWLAHASFDKVTRVLTVGIRRVPAAGTLVPAPSPGQKGQGQDVVVRKRVIGGRWR